MNRWIAGLTFLFLLLPLPLAAEGIVNLVVQGNEVRAGIALPLDITADLSITFEQVEGLSEESIGLSASLVSLTDLQLLSRLHEASNVAGRLRAAGETLRFSLIMKTQQGGLLGRLL